MRSAVGVDAPPDMLRIASQIVPTRVARRHVPQIHCKFHTSIPCDFATTSTTAMKEHWALHPDHLGTSDHDVAIELCCEYNRLRNIRSILSIMVKLACPNDQIPADNSDIAPPGVTCQKLWVGRIRLRMQSDQPTQTATPRSSNSSRGRGRGKGKGARSSKLLLVDLLLKDGAFHENFALLPNYFHDEEHMTNGSFIVFQVKCPAQRVIFHSGKTSNRGWGKGKGKGFKAKRAKTLRPVVVKAFSLPHKECRDFTLEHSRPSLSLIAGSGPRASLLDSDEDQPGSQHRTPGLGLDTRDLPDPVFT